MKNKTKYDIKKMDSTILRTATNYLLPLLLLFSLFVLLRGHYLSGGGFVGGLIASIAFVLHAFAYTTRRTLRLFQIPPRMLIPIGLTLSFISGFLPVILGRPFMTGVWFADNVAVIGSVGTALFFDIGVYLVVVGVVLTILLTISESE
ncbi:Na+/H+ antiporter subunit B [Myroides odoratimimus]|uniref:Na+/H+ antiporter subunit B n=1 Tax=Myroides odoratimimus TaxID=76832 RepID=UPI002DB56747|nr:Na+/H+ antiporter subunit B [Myroides odoratimimus]MEC4051227.1 Na+/H+ antiporter subunit B [Myroides odoratimimus]